MLDAKSWWSEDQLVAQADQLASSRVDGWRLKND